MKLVVAAQAHPRRQGESDELLSELEQSLTGLGHEVDIFRLPAIERASAAMEYAAAAGMLDFGADFDRLVTLGWQCHLLRYPAKIALVEASDPVLTLAGSAFQQSAAARALRQCRRVAVDCAGAQAAVVALSGVEPVLAPGRLCSAESAASWLQ
jgi:hypothetical protein